MDTKFGNRENIQVLANHSPLKAVRKAITPLDTHFQSNEV